jgi:hypothetical protein
VRVSRTSTWVAAGLALGGAVLLRARLRSRATPPAPAESDPAESLRRKLAESRAVDQPVEEAPPAPEEAEPLDPDERRRAIHEEGRSAVDRMRRRATEA